MCIAPSGLGGLVCRQLGLEVATIAVGVTALRTVISNCTNPSVPERYSLLIFSARHRRFFCKSVILSRKIIKNLQRKLHFFNENQKDITINTKKHRLRRVSVPRSGTKKNHVSKVYMHWKSIFSRKKSKILIFIEILMLPKY